MWYILYYYLGSIYLWWLNYNIVVTIIKNEIPIDQAMSYKDLISILIIQYYYLRVLLITDIIIDIIDIIIL